jgi:hypothetical protein
MAHFQRLLDQIRQVQTEVLRRAPFRDIGLVPNPGASEVAIQAAEARLGRSLPESYRQFLKQHDGWPRFFEGATLLGTANLGKRLYQELAQIVFEAAETPVPDVGPISQKRVRPQMIPFGADMQGTTLFAFNPEVVAANGELEVVCWVNEIGVRRDTFTGFLEFVLDLAKSELEGHRAQDAAASEPEVTRRTA